MPYTQGGGNLAWGFLHTHAHTHTHIHTSPGSQCPGSGSQLTPGPHCEEGSSTATPVDRERAGEEQASFLQAGLFKLAPHRMGLSALLCYILHQFMGDAHAVNLVQSCIYLSYTPERA